MHERHAHEENRIAVETQQLNETLANHAKNAEYALQQQTRAAQHLAVQRDWAKFEADSQARLASMRESELQESHHVAHAAFEKSRGTIRGLTDDLRAAMQQSQVQESIVLGLHEAFTTKNEQVVYLEEALAKERQYSVGCLAECAQAQQYLNQAGTYVHQLSDEVREEDGEVDGAEPRRVNELRVRRALLLLHLLLHLAPHLLEFIFGAFTDFVLGPAH